MSHLSTNTAAALSPNTAVTRSIPILNGNANFQIWWQSLKKHVDTRYGLIGQNLFSPHNIITLDHPHPGGNEPNETDQRLNPVTNVAVAGSLKYPRVPLPDGEEPLRSIFDNPLQESAQLRLDKDIANYKSKIQHHKEETKSLRILDDACYAFIEEHMEPNLLDTIETHANWATFKTKSKDANYYMRSKDFLKMTTDVFSTGNMQLVVHNFIKSCIDPQGEQPFTAWLSMHNGNWQSSIKALESKEHPGHVSIEFLEFSFMSYNLSDNPANKTAKNNYYIKHGENITSPRLLIAELVSTNVSLADPNKTDTTSQQGSALIADSSQASALLAAPTARPPRSALPYGAKDAKKGDHCGNCYTLTKGAVKNINGVTYTGPFHFYHSPTKCRRGSKDAAPNNTKAHLAAAGPPPAPAHLTSDAANLAIMQSHLQSYQQLCQQQQDALSMMSTSSLHGT